MSKRLTGLNPLAYIGVEATMPPQMIIAKSSPTPTDSKNVNLGDMWLNESTKTLYVLVSLAAGVATWVTTFGGAASQFNADSGMATDIGGIINLLGDGLNISTLASGNTINVNFSADPTFTDVTVNDDLVVEQDSFLVGNLSLTGKDNGVLTTNGSSVVQVSNGTNGQLLIGGGTVPAWANITSLDNSITITNNANAIDLSAPTATGLTTIHTNSGDANQAAGAVTIHGNGTTLETTGAGSTVTVELVNGTDGQILIGGGASPAWGNLTSMGGTVTITNGANTINLEATGGGSSGASTFITDSGNALENMGDITFAGGSNISTSGAGQTVTIDITGTTNHALQVGNSGGSLTSLDVASNGQIPIGVSGSNPVLANITAGSGINITNGAGSIQISATGGVGGGLTLIQTQTVSSVASLAFTTGITTSYTDYILMMSGVVSAGASGQPLMIQLSDDGGATYISTAYSNPGGASAGLEIVQFFLPTYTLGGSFYLYSLTSNSASSFPAYVRGTVIASSGFASDTHAGGYEPVGFGGIIVNAFRIIMTGGQTFSGKFSLYGYSQ